MDPRIQVKLARFEPTTLTTPPSTTPDIDATCVTETSDLAHKDLCESYKMTRSNHIYLGAGPNIYESGI